MPAESTLSPVARKRLAAIREFSDLGSGFRIAALDLEIRGAGNLLGGEQSGHIEAVGFEMYMKLLEETVRELKGEDLEDDTRATVNLKVDLRIEPDYIPDMNQRLAMYRRIAAARTRHELDTIVEELQDRYGPVPASLLNLVEYGRIRVVADELKLESLEREGQLVVLKFRNDAKVDPSRLIELVHERTDLILAPPAVLKLDMRKPTYEPRTTAVRRQAESRPARTGRMDSQGVSWWTARATAGEVKPGFSREEILKPEPEDPRAPGGVFTRVGALLAELSGPARLR